MINGGILPSAAAANPARTDAGREKRSRTLRMKFFTSWLRQIVCPAVMRSRSPADADRGEGEPRGRKLVCKDGRAGAADGALTWATAAGHSGWLPELLPPPPRPLFQYFCLGKMSEGRPRRGLLRLKLFLGVLNPRTADLSLRSSSCWERRNFSCQPSDPIGWSGPTWQRLIGCFRWHLPRVFMTLNAGKKNTL